MELKEYQCSVEIDNAEYTASINAYNYLHAAKQFALSLQKLKTKYVYFRARVEEGGTVVSCSILLKGDEIEVEEVK